MFSEKQLKVREILEDLKTKGFKAAYVGRKIGYVANESLRLVKNGLQEISDEKLNALKELHKHEMKPDLISHNNSRWDELEKELDKKLGLA